MTSVKFLSRIILVTSILSVAAPQLLAQAPGVPIETNGARADEPVIIERAEKLRVAGRLMDINRVREQMKAPVKGPIELPKPNTVALPARELAQRARTGHVQVGWYYRCTSCDRWHLNLPGGYAIAKDAVATCNHCVEPGDNKREGFLIAVDHKGEVLPVTGIISCSEKIDTAVLRVEGGDFTPLPLNDQVAPGDAAYCFSAPLGRNGYFSAGMVNRFYWSAKKNSDSPDELKGMRVNVSTDWAPGSSGSAVVDTAGNVIGHVSTISSLNAGRENKEKEKGKGDTMIILHEAVPARGVMALARGEVSADSKPVKPAVVADAKKKEEKPVAADGGAKDKAEKDKAAKSEKDNGVKAAGLDIGDPAPKLAIGKWIQGEPVTEFARDKAYLVEFWATWCGPCIKNIPHLDELHRKFADKGLVVIGQNCLEPDQARVEPFVKARGEKMTYRVALDRIEEGGKHDTGVMQQTWMKAAGESGIPCAFLVDKTGKIAWIGHPGLLNDGMIEEVLAGKFDIEKARIQRSQDITMQKFQRRIAEATKAEQWVAVGKLIDELEGNLPEGRKSGALFARVALGKKTKNHTMMNAAVSKAVAAPDLTDRLANSVAWEVAIAEGIDGIDLAAAERLARRGVELAKGSGRAPILDTLARLVFRSGRQEEAIKLQDDAIACTEDEKLKVQLSETREAYKKGTLPAAK